MSSACRSALLLGLLCVAAAAHSRELRVCADPDNLPLSHADGSGFENRVARLVADELRAELRYAWLPLRRGFVRKTMDAGLCDVFIGVPKDFERVLTTRPYYRSSYVFVDGPGARGVDHFDDRRLKSLRIGVQLVGNDLAATPPGLALAMNGNVENVRGFTVYGDGPAAQRMVAALANHKLDAAVVWGPQAGYFAKRSTTPLDLRIARPPVRYAGVPFEFDIAMGVRRGDTALRDDLDAVIDRRRADIDAILAAYSVPRTDHSREAGQ
ncbi:MAG TPA: quinoprotein dehydrogenase-associated putative ABC transporter substrate-binding protein [Casimicrobiaceae bacterium]|nr:quinoprotein dehydrogenase-associated putative ABC transporter substrate-binding protein [Casimicrobiaceae bacterium]